MWVETRSRTAAMHECMTPYPLSLPYFDEPQVPKNANRAILASARYCGAAYYSLRCKEVSNFTRLDMPFLKVKARFLQISFDLFPIYLCLFDKG